MTPRRGPSLPYSVIAGVTPTGSRWLVASAKLQGATFAPEEPRVYATFREVLDEVPSFSAVVVNAPIGYLDSGEARPRTCDREARALLGRRAVVIHNPPTRAVLEGSMSWEEARLDAVTAMFLANYREVAEEMSAYRQRVVFQGHPELSFYQLNRDNPLRQSKRREGGRMERRAVLELRVPGVARILNAEIEGMSAKHQFDAAALLWSARRVFGRAAQRIPADPEWDSEGLRVEYVI